MIRRIAPVAFGLLATLAAVGVVLAARVDVHVGSFYFEDASAGDGKVVVNVGDQIRFVFDDSGAAGKRHAAEVSELGIYSGPQSAGASWTSPVITQAGTFRLFCRFHQAAPNNHFTTLVVLGATITPGPTKAPTPTPAKTRPPTSPPTQTTTSPPGSGGTDATPVASTPRASTRGGDSTPAPGRSSGAAATTAAPVASGSGAVTPAGSENASGAGSTLVAASPGDGPGFPVGGEGPGPTTWLRSVWVGILGLAPIWAVALVAAGRAHRRGDRAARRG